MVQAIDNIWNVLTAVDSSNLAELAMLATSFTK